MNHKESTPASLTEIVNKLKDKVKTLLQPKISDVKPQRPSLSENSRKEIEEMSREF